MDGDEGENLQNYVNVGRDIEEHPVAPGVSNIHDNLAFDEEHISSLGNQQNVNFPLNAKVVSFTKQYDNKYCIICQKKGGKAFSTENGRDKLKKAAEMHNDDVSKRIKTSDNFVYHISNDCYGKYRNSQLPKSSIEPIDPMLSIETVEHTPSKVKCQRSQVSPRSTPSADTQINSNYLNCVICGSCRKKNDRKKFRLCETDRALNFINATMYLKGEVHARVADLLPYDPVTMDASLKKVFAADLYSHPTCMRAFLQKYAKAKDNSMLDDQEDHENEDDSDSQYFNKSLFLQTVAYVDEMLGKGLCFTLSDIRDLMINILKTTNQVDQSHIRSICENDSTFKNLNRIVKRCLKEHYGDTIQFCQNIRRRDGEMLFSSSCTPDAIASKLKNINVMREAGLHLRDTLQEVDFGLHDKFGEAEGYSSYK